METYHKIQTLFKRDLDGSITGQKGKMIRGAWTTPELEYLAGNEWEFTEKVDGTNIRVEYVPNDTMKSSHVNFAGRTDRAVIPPALTTHLKETFTPQLFHEAGFVDDGVLLFGEGYGPKIQGGGKYRGDHSFVLFDVKIGDWWLNRADVNDIANKLGIDSVPVLGYGTLHYGVEWVKAGLMSQWNLDTNQEFEAEGIVARPKVPMFNRKGERIITKIKAVDFK